MIIIIFNLDVVLTKWEKNHNFILKTHYEKNDKTNSYHDFNYYPQLFK
jgi:hypothetical protein